MKSSTIRFSTDILRRLGEELNPSADQGILELVKNAYDANARHCTVELVKVDRPNGKVSIVDDGDGMDVEEIDNGWLVLGRSRKLRNKRTRLGRIPAGSKGLGRLAALRLGKTASLVTRPRSARTSQHSLVIDWGDYDNAKVVEDVTLDIRTSRRAEKSKSGTEILISGIRSRVSKMDIKRLARALILLADPFGDSPTGFEPVLKAPEYRDLEKLVSNRYFSDAEYHLTARIDKKGLAKATVTDWKGSKLYSAEHSDLTAHRGNKTYSCPPARFDLWVFILTPQVFTSRSTTVGEVRSWLGSFGGVHLYENGLRVSPYGNPGNDWLDMNLRRVQNPEERPGTNTSIGRVSVTDVKEELIQKTDRSGFIESETFSELRSFAQDSLEWMARRRLAIAEKRRANERKKTRKKSSRSKRKVEDVIEKIPGRARSNVEVAFKQYERSRDREVNALQKEVQLYRTLSTAGITAATFAHESQGNPIKAIGQSILAIKRRGKKALGDEYARLLEKPVDGIIASIDSLAVLSTATLNLVSQRKRRLGRVNIHDVIENVLQTFEPFLRGRDVTPQFEPATGNPYLRGSEAAIESVVTNLVNNSLVAFEIGKTRRRKLLIRTTIEDGTLELCALDNGPGIEGISIKDIWLPGQTTLPNGTGLGLAIVRDTIRDLGGDVRAVDHGELGGAEITVRLPILGV